MAHVSPGYLYFPRNRRDGTWWRRRPCARGEIKGEMGLYVCRLALFFGAGVTLRAHISPNALQLTPTPMAFPRGRRKGGPTLCQKSDNGG